MEEFKQEVKEKLDTILTVLYEIQTTRSDFYLQNKVAELTKENKVLRFKALQIKDLVNG